MKPSYIIVWKGLKEGVYYYEWRVGDGFWADYPESGILRGEAEVKIKMEVGRGGVKLEIGIEGSVTVECDRCLDECELPVRHEDELTAKYSDVEMDLRQYIYESIILALPLLRVHPDKAQCNPEMLKRITE